MWWICCFPFHICAKWLSHTSKYWNNTVHFCISKRSVGARPQNLLFMFVELIKKNTTTNFLDNFYFWDSQVIEYSMKRCTMKGKIGIGRWHGNAHKNTHSLASVRDRGKKQSIRLVVVWVFSFDHDKNCSKTICIVIDKSGDTLFILARTCAQVWTSGPIRTALAVLRWFFVRSFLFSFTLTWFGVRFVLLARLTFVLIPHSRVASCIFNHMSDALGKAWWDFDIWTETGTATYCCYCVSVKQFVVVVGVGRSSFPCDRIKQRCECALAHSVWILYQWKVIE